MFQNSKQTNKKINSMDIHFSSAVIFFNSSSSFLQKQYFIQENLSRTSRQSKTTKETKKKRTNKINFNIYIFPLHSKTNKTKKKKVTELIIILDIIFNKRETSTLEKN